MAGCHKASRYFAIVNLLEKQSMQNSNETGENKNEV